MKTIFKIALFVIAILFISSCTDKRNKISEAKDLDTISSIGIQQKPVYINQDSILKQLGIRVYLDSTFVISVNKLRSNSIPDWVFKMKNLKNLAIIGMDCEYEIGEYGAYTIKDNCFKIQEIPSKIQELTSLTSLSLPVNEIQTIPIELSTLKNLKFIDLSDNSGLHDVNSIEKIISLESLSLSRCHLTKMPNNIGNLRHLKELALNGNLINEKEKIRIKKALLNCNITF